MGWWILLKPLYNRIRTPFIITFLDWKKSNMHLRERPIKQTMSNLLMFLSGMWPVANRLNHGLHSITLLTFAFLFIYFIPTCVLIFLVFIIMIKFNILFSFVCE